MLHCLQRTPFHSFRTVNYDFQNKLAIIVFRPTGHVESFGRICEAFEAMCDQFCQINAILHCLLDNLDAFWVRVGVSEYSNDVDFSKRCGSEWECLYWMAHSDQH
jgi:hypothetical protein